MVSHPDWPRYTPQSAHSIPAAFSLLLHVAANGRWDNVAEAGKAAFFIRASLALQKSSGDYFLALDPGPFAILVWPCERVEAPTVQIKPRVDKEAGPCWVHVFDFDSWEAYQVTPKSPLQVRCQGQATGTNDAVHLTLAAEGEGILKHAAKHAFGTATDFLLQKLISHLNVKVKYSL